MENWLEDYYTLLEQKKKDISISDFRFYNIGRLPLLAAKTSELSQSCHRCRANLKELQVLAEKLPECLEDLKQRREFEHHKNLVENHLRQEHAIRPAHYYYAKYTLIGAVSGIVAGSIISFIIYDEFNVNLPFIFFALGLITGQLMGRRADRIRYKHKRQI